MSALSLFQKKYKEKFAPMAQLEISNFINEAYAQENTAVDERVSALVSSLVTRLNTALPGLGATSEEDIVAQLQKYNAETCNKRVSDLVTRINEALPELGATSGGDVVERLKTFNAENCNKVLTSSVQDLTAVKTFVFNSVKDTLPEKYKPKDETEIVTSLTTFVRDFEKTETEVESCKGYMGLPTETGLLEGLKEKVGTVATVVGGSGPPGSFEELLQGVKDALDQLKKSLTSENQPSTIAAAADSFDQEIKKLQEEKKSALEKAGTQTGPDVFTKLLATPPATLEAGVDAVRTEVDEVAKLVNVTGWKEVSEVKKAVESVVTDLKAVNLLVGVEENAPTSELKTVLTKLKEDVEGKLGLSKDTKLVDVPPEVVNTLKKVPLVQNGDTLQSAVNKLTSLSRELGTLSRLLGLGEKAEVSSIVQELNKHSETLKSVVGSKVQTAAGRGAVGGFDGSLPELLKVLSDFRVEAALKFGVGKDVHLMDLPGLVLSKLQPFAEGDSLVVVVSSLEKAKGTLQGIIPSSPVESLEKGSTEVANVTRSTLSNLGCSEGTSSAACTQEVLQKLGGLLKKFFGSSDPNDLKSGLEELSKNLEEVGSELNAELSDDMANETLVKKAESVTSSYYKIKNQFLDVLYGATPGQDVVTKNAQGHEIVVDESVLYNELRKQVNALLMILTGEEVESGKNLMVSEVKAFLKKYIKKLNKIFGVKIKSLDQSLESLETLKSDNASWTATLGCSQNSTISDCLNDVLNSVRELVQLVSEEKVDNIQGGLDELKKAGILNMVVEAVGPKVPPQELLSKLTELGKLVGVEGANSGVVIPVPSIIEQAQVILDTVNGTTNKKYKSLRKAAQSILKQLVEQPAPPTARSPETEAPAVDAPQKDPKPTAPPSQPIPLWANFPFRDLYEENKAIYENLKAYATSSTRLEPLSKETAAWSQTADDKYKPLKLLVKSVLNNVDSREEVQKFLFNLVKDGLKEYNYVINLPTDEDGTLDYAKYARKIAARLKTDGNTNLFPNIDEYQKLLPFDNEKPGEGFNKVTKIAALLQTEEPKAPAPSSAPAPPKAAVSKFANFPYKQFFLSYPKVYDDLTYYPTFTPPNLSSRPSLTSWLADNTSDRAYDPLKQLVRETANGDQQKMKELKDFMRDSVRAALRELTKSPSDKSAFDFGKAASSVAYNLKEYPDMQQYRKMLPNTFNTTSDYKLDVAKAEELLAQSGGDPGALKAKLLLLADYLSRLS